MDNISIQDIIEGEFNYSSLPAIAYDEFGGVYDYEDIDYIDAVGIGDDNNIYLARSHEELYSLKQNQVYIKRCICGIPDFLKMMVHIKYLLGNNIDRNVSVYIKDGKGYVLPIKEIAVDEVGGRVIFVTQYKVVDSYV